MGVYIANMDKPKRCGKCELWSNCFYPKNPYTEQDDYIAPDCPLIEIDLVRCSECMYWHDVDCREIRYGIEARCHYKDVREGYLAEKQT